MSELQVAPPCLVCHSRNAMLWAEATDVEYCTTKDKFRFYECPECGVLFISPVPQNRLREIYPTNYYSFVTQKRSLVSGIKDWLDRRLFRKLLRQLPGNSIKVLDVGGGNGAQLDVVRTADPRVQMTQIVDLDPDAGVSAQQKGHAYFCGVIEQFQSEHKFDLVLLLNLIEHVRDPGAILAKVGSLLSPHGVALVKTPNYRSLDARIYRNKSWGGYHCPRHWVLFDRRSFVSLAEKSKLRVHRFNYTQGAPFWTVSVLAGLARWGLASITRDRPAMFHPLFKPLAAGFAGFDFFRAALGAKTSQMFIELRRSDGA